MRLFIVHIFFMGFFHPAIAQIEKSIGKIEADFKGGKPEFNQLLMKEMVYPETLLLENKAAKIGFEVLVHENEKTEIIRQLFSADEAFNKEARRLVEMTQFLPAAQDGIPMPSTKQVVIKFKPKKYHKYIEERGYDYPPNFEKNSNLRVYYPDEVDRTPIPKIPEPYNDLSQYIYSHLKYPPHALKMNITGKAILEFVVEPSGNITNVYPIHYLGGGCFEEARRVLGEITWYPAIKNGKPTRCEMSHTVYFTLPSSGKKNQ